MNEGPALAGSSSEPPGVYESDTANWEAEVPSGSRDQPKGGSRNRRSKTRSRSTTSTEDKWGDSRYTGTPNVGYPASREASPDPVVSIPCGHTYIEF